MEKITPQHPYSGSENLILENIEQLKQIFPEVIKEGKVDKEALLDLLGEYSDTAEERFCLNWAGKAQARREAQKRSTGTLRPCPEDSVDWDNTENLYIEGDNLEVLKLLQKSYHKQVKMIYIDPPYNTGKDFVYKDNYKDNMANYLELTGQDRKMSTKALSDSDGRYHSNWLNMMYPRLKLARNLLTDDGVIFISIDDNEVDNLKKICNEIFGEENFVADITIIVKTEGRRYGYFAKTHEKLIVCSKNISLLELNEIEVEGKSFSYVDNIGGYNLKELRNQNTRAFNSTNRPNLRYPFYVNLESADSNGICELDTENREGFTKIYAISVDELESVWRWGKDTAKDNLHNLAARRGSDGIIRIYQKYRKLTETPKTVWFDKKFISIKGTQEVQELIGKGIFDFPKPLALSKTMLEVSSSKDDIVLDFFSGSATTAHAVMQLNLEDGGKRKYICVQIPEATPEDSEARKAGYETIPEIAKERIRRAGGQILKQVQNDMEKEAGNSNEVGLFARDEAAGEKQKPKLDIGFKVFKLDSSNINSWDSDPNNLEESLNSSLFNIKADRSEDDLLYEILLKFGAELTTKINKVDIAGKTVYEMNAGSLIVCLADGLTTEVAEGIASLWEDVRPEGTNIPCKVVFKDSGFNNSDEAKTNSMLILKQHGITNIFSV